MIPKTFKINSWSIIDLSKNVDFTIASSLTTASLDINYLGLPIFIILNGATLNMSPTIENEYSTYIRTFEELLSAVNAFSHPLPAKSSGDSMFFLDPSLVKWKTFIKNSL